MSKETQKREAMDELFGSLTIINNEKDLENFHLNSRESVTTPPEKPQAPAGSAAAKPKEDPAPSYKHRSATTERYYKTNESVCTIINIALMNKVRYIAAKENLPIRDVFEVGLMMAVEDYESRHGTIPTSMESKTKKGDPSRVFSLNSSKKK